MIGSRYVHRSEQNRFGDDAKKFKLLQMANICDAGYVGTPKTLAILSPLLRSPLQNQHATVITLYLNAVMEMVKMGGKENAPPNIEMLMRYLSFPRRFSPLSTNNADMLRFWDARSLVLDVKKFFERFSENSF